METVTTDSLTLQNIANAIREKTKKTDKMYPSQMAEEIMSIEAEKYEFPLNADMVMIKKLCEEDSTPNKVIELYKGLSSYTRITVPAGGRVVTSDGETYTTTSFHYWDSSKDIESEYYTDCKLRWTIKYYPSNTGLLSLHDDTIYAVIDGIQHSDKFTNLYMLEYFEYINNGKYVGTTFNLMFNGCTSLKSIPYIDTSMFTDFSSVFYKCPSLQSIPLLDTSNVENFTSAFRETGLNTIPKLDFSSATNLSYMFMNSTKLQSIPELNTLNVTNFTRMLYGAKRLTTIKSLDFKSATNLSYIYSSAGDLQDVTFLNLSKSIDISSATLLPRENVVNGILNNLVDLTGSTAQTLKIGTINVNRLTEEDKLIATNKNWILA